ncbi:hypothetical protein AB4144_38370 [Rhizobiaceae sp. 2RAB30]
MAVSTEAQVARLDERLNGIERAVASILEELKAASEGRRRGYEASERVDRENHRHHASARGGREER